MFTPSPLRATWEAPQEAVARIRASDGGRLDYPGPSPRPRIADGGRESRLVAGAFRCRGLRRRDGGIGRRSGPRKALEVPHFGEDRFAAHRQLTIEIAIDEEPRECTRLSRESRE